VQLVNPDPPSPYAPHIEARLASNEAASVNWGALLPHDPIVVSGRVPTKLSVKFIADSRFNPSRQVVVAAFTADTGASDEVKKVWEETIEWYIGREYVVPLPPSSAAC
jgi:hypothetical protein